VTYPQRSKSGLSKIGAFYIIWAAAAGVSLADEPAPAVTASWVVSAPAEAELASEDGSAPLENVQWSTDLKRVPVRIEIATVEGGTRGLVASIALKGVFGSKDHSLILIDKRKGSQEQAIQFKERKDGSREFFFEVPLGAEETRFQLSAVSPTGKPQIQKFIAKFPAYAEFNEAAKLEPPRRWRLRATLGGSANYFQQTDVTDITQFDLMGKLDFAWSFLRPLQPPRWQAGIQAFGTILPLVVRPNSNFAIRFLGGSIRGTYLIQFKGVWELGINAGFYYITTLNASDQFGFRNMSGPQLYPSIRRTINAQSEAAAYARYSPVMNRFTFLGLDSHEAGAGLSYTRFLAKGRTLTFSAEWMNLAFTLSSNNVVENQIFLGVGFGI